MFRCLLKNNSPLILNKKICDYYRNSTNESIRRLIEKNKSEKNKLETKIYLSSNDDKNNNNPIIYKFIFFFTFTSIAFYLYKRLK
jgi:hypothetical protein